jgi:hypothetical protein
MRIIGWALAAFLFVSPVVVSGLLIAAESDLVIKEGEIEFIGGDSTIIDAEPTSNVDFYGPNQELIVRIKLDTKTIEYGPGYTPDAAAKVFWEALLHAPSCDDIYSLGEEQEETAHEQE